MIKNLNFIDLKIEERHSFLYDTIGYLPEEKEAFEKVNFLLFGSFGYMIVGSVLEMILFYLYNNKCHPFKNILVSDDGQKSSRMIGCYLLVLAIIVALSFCGLIVITFGLAL